MAKKERSIRKRLLQRSRRKQGTVLLFISGLSPQNKNKKPISYDQFTLAIAEGINNRCVTNLRTCLRSSSRYLLEFKQSHSSYNLYLYNNEKTYFFCPSNQFSQKAIHFIDFLFMQFRFNLKKLHFMS